VPLSTTPSLASSVSFDLHRERELAIWHTIDRHASSMRDRPLALGQGIYRLALNLKIYTRLVRDADDYLGRMIQISPGLHGLDSVGQMYVPGVAQHLALEWLQDGDDSIVFCRMRLDI
jgi:hypothetical protein